MEGGRQGTRRGRRAAAALAAGLILGSSAATPSLASAPEPGIRVVGKLPLYAPPGSSAESLTGLILNSSTRRGYQVFEIFRSTWIRSFDLDTLEPIRLIEIPGLLPIYPRGYGGVMHAVDEDGGRVFLPVSEDISRDLLRKPIPQVISSDAVRGFSRLLVLDERAFDGGDPTAISHIELPVAQSTELFGRNLLGLSYSTDAAGRGVLTSLWASISLAPGAFGQSPRYAYEHWAAQWDADTGAGRWVIRLEPCQQAKMRYEFGRYPLAIVATPRMVLLPCQLTEAVAQAVRIPLDGEGRPETSGIQGFPAPFPYREVLADPVSERLMFLHVAAAQTWWVFDGRARAWVGLVGVANTDIPSGPGIDRRTGRVYNLVPDHRSTLEGATGTFPGGVFLTDGRLTPVPQARAFLREIGSPSHFAMAVDPGGPERATRIFALRGDHGQAEDSYFVLEDRVPVPVQPTLSAVDRFTSGEPEREGRTGANFEGSASGYGARLVLTGGVVALNAQASAYHDIVFQQYGSACSRADREIAAGGVYETRLGNSLAVARAAPIDIDATTKADLEDPAGRCWPDRFLVPAPQSGAGHPWTDRTAGCTGTGEAQSPPPPAGTRLQAEVSCRHGEGVAEASSVAALNVTGALAVSVGHAQSQTSVLRDSKRGTVSRVESIARGVDIDGVGRIEAVRTVAETWAGGRKGTAGSRFERMVCGARIGSFVREPCGAPEPVVAALNRVLGTRGQARLREADAELAAGSPGGFLAGVQKDRSEEFSDSIVSRDGSAEVPGLEIILFNDRDGKAGRQILQLAGVRTSSTYGIFSQPVFGALGAGPGPGFAAGDSAGVLGSDPYESAAGEPETATLLVGQDPGAGGGLVARILGRVLLLRSLGEGLLTATVWFVLGLPVYLATRRLALLRAGGAL